MVDEIENSLRDAKLLGNGDVNVPISAFKDYSTQQTLDNGAAFYQELISVINLSNDNESNDILDELTLNFSKDSQQRSKHPSGHIPQLLQGSGKNKEAIALLIKHLIEFENFDSEEADKSRLINAMLPCLDSASKWSIIGQSLSSYVSLLELNHLKNLATRILSDVALWVCRIFKFPDGVSHYHDDEKEGIVKICRLALHKKYPKYSSDGYEVLFTRPPVIYISGASKYNLGQYICNQIGLPLNCAQKIPCILGHIDINNLIKLIEEDQKMGKNPLVVVAYAGTPLLGQTDNISRLQEICTNNDIWLHIEGNGLSMLSFPNVPSVLTSATLCDSMTLNVGAWLGLPSVPFITLFKSPDVAMTRLVNLSTFNVRYKLVCTSTWLTMLHLGYDKILARMHYHTYLASAIYEKIIKISSTNELITLPLESPTVIFRFQIKEDVKNIETEKRKKYRLRLCVDATALRSWIVH